MKPTRYLTLLCILASQAMAGPLHDAAAKGDARTVAALVAKKGNIDERAGFDLGKDLPNKEVTALMIAANLGHDGIVDQLLKAGAQSALTAPTESVEVYDALELAARAGHVKVVDRLLAARPSEEARQSALWHAASMGADKVVETLIRARTPVDPRVWGIAAQEGRSSVIAALLRLDAQARETSGLLALGSAAQYGQTAIVDLLVKGGVDINGADDDGLTALHAAARYGEDIRGIRALLGAGINPRLKDQNGRTALFGVTDGKTAALLISAGIDVNARDAKGLTPLLDLITGRQWASDDEPTALEALIRAGADVNAVDALGRTALAHRTQRFNPAEDRIAQRLIRAGAKPGNDCAGWARYQDAVVTRNAALKKWSADVGAFNADVPGMSRGEYREGREALEDRKRALELDNWSGFRALRGFVNLSKAQMEEFHRFCNQSSGSGLPDWD